MNYIWWGAMSISRIMENNKGREGSHKIRKIGRRRLWMAPCKNRSYMVLSKEKRSRQEFQGFFVTGASWKSLVLHRAVHKSFIQKQVYIAMGLKKVAKISDSRSFAWSEGAVSLKKWTFPTFSTSAKSIDCGYVTGPTELEGWSVPDFGKSFDPISIRGRGQIIPTTLLLTCHPDFQAFLRPYIRNLTKMHCGKIQIWPCVHARNIIMKYICFFVFDVKWNIISDTYEIQLNSLFNYVWTSMYAT